MYRSSIDKISVRRCLLCYEAPCTAACLAKDPARILRALRFDNEDGAALLAAKDKACIGCQAPCTAACPNAVPIPAILSSLSEDSPQMEAAPGAAEINLFCDLCGIHLENPFLLSSSVVASSYEMCARAFRAGWAGTVFKTVSLMDIHEASPRFTALKGGDGSFYGFTNIEQLSDHMIEENLHIFKRLKTDYPDKILIASIMGRDEREWEALATAVTLAGADAIECNFSCPNMEEKNAGVDVGQDPGAVYAYTKATRRGSALPILAKMTPNVAEMLSAARAAMAGGADGIAAINTIKSIANVNLDTYATAPTVKGRSVIGGYSGTAVKPIALKFLAELGNDEALKGVHISGMGGIETWRDAVEFLMLGAGSLQVTTSVMQFGFRIIDDLLLGLRVFMAQRGFRDVRELVGLALENIVEKDELERDTVLYPRIDIKRCMGCGRCFLSCRDGGHQAIRFDAQKRKPSLIAKNCVGCHLCALVCPAGAISTAHKRLRRS